MRYSELSLSAKAQVVIEHRLLFNLPQGSLENEIVRGWSRNNNDVFTKNGFFKNWKK
jgi:hypothetical protein